MKSIGVSATPSIAMLRHPDGTPFDLMAALQGGGGAAVGNLDGGTPASVPVPVPVDGGAP